MTVQSSLDHADALIDQAAHAVEGAITSTQQTASHAVDALAAQAHQVHHGIAPVLARAADQASLLAQRGADGAREASRKLQGRAEAWSASTTQYIQEQPLQAVLIAAATGAVTAALVSLLLAPRTRH